MASIGSHVYVYWCKKTVVRAVYGNTKCFEVNVGMHQGSALSPLLFMMLWKPYLENSRVALP